MRLHVPALTLVLTDDPAAYTSIQRQHDPNTLGLIVESRTLGRLFSSGKLQCWIALRGSMELQTVTSQRGEKAPLITLYRGVGFTA